jgi:hypothetical protein
MSTIFARWIERHTFSFVTDLVSTRITGRSGESRAGLAAPQVPKQLARCMTAQKWPPNTTGSPQNCEPVAYGVMIEGGWSALVASARYAS